MHWSHGKNDRVLVRHKRSTMVLLPAICILLLVLTWIPVFQTIYMSGIPFGLPSMVKLGSYMFAAFAASSNAASFAPILPPSYPLAVRNPYLSGTIVPHSFHFKTVYNPSFESDASCHLVVTFRGSRSRHQISLVDLQWEASVISQDVNLHSNRSYQNDSGVQDHLLQTR